MLLLTATTDKISMTTGSATAVDLDVHASYMKHTLSTDNVEGARTNTNYTTASGTTDIVPVPTSGDTVNVKTLHIRNAHATVPVDVTINYNQNGTLFELFKCTLRAQEHLEYIEGVGFFVVGYTTKLDTKLRVSADVVNATTSFADCTGLTCPVESGKHYNFECLLVHQTNATTTGAQFGIGGVTMTSMIAWGLGQITASVTAATFGSSAAVTAVDTAYVVETTGPGAVNMGAYFGGWFNPSASGTFAIRQKSEVAVASGLTIKAGSWCRVWEADN